LAASDVTFASIPDALKDVPMFSELRDSDLVRLAGLLHRRRYRKNEVIVLQGKRVTSLSLVAAGRVKLVVTGEDGNEVILSTRGPVDFFGELSLFDDHPLEASAIAMEDSELLVLSREDFHRSLRELPEIAVGLLRALCHRLRQADSRISALTLLDVPQRVAHVLLELADDNDGTLITQPVTHRFLAQLVGTSRETVSRTMSQLAEDGVIAVTRENVAVPERRHPAPAAGAVVQVKRRAIRIQNRARLEAAAGKTLG